MHCNTAKMLHSSEIHNQMSADNTVVLLIIKYSLSLSSCVHYEKSIRNAIA